MFLIATQGALLFLPERFEIVETALRVSSPSKQASGAAKAMTAMTTTILSGCHEGLLYAHTVLGVLHTLPHTGATRQGL